jgi:hypothetical protein
VAGSDKKWKEGIQTKKQGFMSSMIRMIRIAISVDDTHSLTHLLSSLAGEKTKLPYDSFIHSFIRLSVCLSGGKQKASWRVGDPK